jgi:hypothetical protein
MRLRLLSGTRKLSMMFTRAGTLLAMCVFTLAVVLPCGAQQVDPRSLAKAALDAYQTRDYASFLALEERALALSPDDPRTLYNVACGQALTSHPVEAVRLLDRLVARGLDLGADEDPDFTGIHKTPGWADFEQKLLQLRKPLVRSTIAFTLPDKDLIATSLAMDEETGATYIASSHERKIIKRAKDGTLTDFATQKDGLFAVSYLLIDPARRQLIATTTGVPLMQGYRKEDGGKSGIFIFDLATGKLLRHVLLPETEPHLLNQAVVNQDGDIFVVDNATHEIDRLRIHSNEIELYISSVVFLAPQSLALSADQRTLYVADILQGLFAVQVLSTDLVHLDSKPALYLSGLEGISRVKDGFIGVQIGVQPNRVIRIRLDSSGPNIASMETLESNHPDYLGPVQGTVSGDNFFYIANSQLALVNQKTGVISEDRARATTVLRLPFDSK